MYNSVYLGGMKAMIFAAGLGTRLRPLTDHKPKALVEVGGEPLLGLALRNLARYGVTEAVVNVHHFADQVEDYLSSVQTPLRIHISNERQQLLDTGGGLKKARPWLQDAPFIACNVDVLSGLDIRAFYQAHLDSGAMATLAVRSRETSRYLQFDEGMQLTGWRNAKTGAHRACRPTAVARDFAFSGIHCISPELFGFMPETAVFSIIDVYLEAARSQRVLGYPHDDTPWMDVGKHHALGPAAELAARLFV